MLRILRACPHRGAASLLSSSSSAPCRALSLFSSSPLCRQSAGSGPDAAALDLRTADLSATPSEQHVWNLWNEGNLFSLSVAELTNFLVAQRCPVQVAAPASGPGGRDAGRVRKAALVRQLEEYLQAKDAAAAVGSNAGMQQGGGAGSGRDPWAAAAAAPPAEALLDLSQSSFYSGAGGAVGGAEQLAPKAFQLLLRAHAADAIVSRVNTSAFPGYPANTECYTLTSADNSVAVHARFSKVLQWCYVNMHNLQLDGELRLSLGKFLVTNRGAAATATTTPSFVKGEVLSSYTAQQRLQLHQPYLFVETLPESAVPVAEAFLLQQEQFTLLPAVGGRANGAQLTFEGKIKRAADELAFELNEDGTQLLSIHKKWISLQTSFMQEEGGGLDLCVALRSRPALSRAEVEEYTPTAQGGNRIIELVEEDVSDVLPPEKGQVIYLSENSTRTFEKLLTFQQHSPSGSSSSNAHGHSSPYVLRVTETRRQPLIVLYDHEEDPRIEYTFHVALQNTASGGYGGSQMIDIRSLGTEVLGIAERFREALNGTFVEAYGCTPIA